MTWQLTNTRTGQVVVTHLEVADGYFSRLAGLQFRRSLPPGAGLLLVPCGSVHTFCMRFSITVVALDAAGQILQITPALRPWRVGIVPRQTHAILELPAGEHFLQVGDGLRVTGAEVHVPRSLAFLQQPTNLPPR